jgi:hypothetical protein
MAEPGNTQGGIFLADDLMMDRSRQFNEFLDDQVGARRGKKAGLLLTRLDQEHVQLQRGYQADA